jgi:tetratricopeptide (TPR) repeat protein
VLRLDPLSKEALLIKARNDVSQDKLDDALVSYIKLSQIDQSDPIIFKELGELHLKRGQPDRACPHFRSALQLSQASPDQRADIEWKLGVAYAQSERWSMADDILERAIVNRQASDEDFCLLGWVRMQSGDHEGARALLNQVRISKPQSAAMRKLAEQLESTTDFPPNAQQIRPVSYQVD